jgi:hypothetical protein
MSTTKQFGLFDTVAVPTSFRCLQCGVEVDRNSVSQTTYCAKHAQKRRAYAKVRYCFGSRFGLFQPKPWSDL